jgi:hypothetical protein
MTTKIQLAPGLSFPAAEFATEVVASLGTRGGGKSNGAAVVAEGLLDAGVQVVVLDYVGIWFSLRLDPDGKTPSRFKIAVLGGSHGDIGLASTAGAVAAEAMAISGASAILDISGFSKGDRCRFATDFAEAFFVAKKKHPGPVQLLLEEAQRFVPQKLFTGQERMLGAFEEIGEVGRNYGIGLHLISQRPQKINKDVLNLADTVLGYRTLGVLERKAIGEWVQEKGAAGRERVQDELPSLKVGNAIVWCPSRDLYGKYAIRKKSTYDAGATPVQARAAVHTKPLDLGELEAAMGQAVEDAKANDPRALKAEISRLQKELAKSTGKPPEVVAGKTIEVPFVPPEWRSALAKAREQTAFMLVALEKATDATRDAIVGLEKCEGALPPMPVRRAFAPAPPVQISRRTPALVIHTKREDLGGGLRRMLIALAQRLKGLTNAQIGVRAGLSSKSGTFATYMGRARSQGWINDNGNTRFITEAGLEALGSFDPLPEGQELAAYWIGELGGGASRMLQALVDAYPEALTNAEIGERAGISSASGTFATYMGKIRSLELVTGRGQVRASAELFD